MCVVCVCVCVCRWMRSVRSWTLFLESSTICCFITYLPAAPEDQRRSSLDHWMSSQDYRVTHTHIHELKQHTCAVTCHLNRYSRHWSGHSNTSMFCENVTVFHSSLRQITKLNWLTYTATLNIKLTHHKLDEHQYTQQLKHADRNIFILFIWPISKQCVFVLFIL